MEFIVQLAAFFAGVGSTVAIAIAINAYKQASARVVHGDQTGGDIVGRHNLGTMTINGRTYTGNSIQMIGNRIVIDGKDVTDASGVDMKSVLEIKVTGDVQDVSADKGLTVVGTVKGNIDARGSVNCEDIKGDVKAGGSVNADNVGGSVYANGSVNCDRVSGSVQAGGSVRHG